MTGRGESAIIAGSDRRSGRPSRARLRVRLETEAFAGVCDHLSETVVFFTSGARAALYRNDGPNGHWLVVQPGPGTGG